MADSSANWADTAASLLSKLSGGVEMNLAFDQMEVQVPNMQNPAAAPSTWRINGSIRIRTRGESPAASIANPTPQQLG
jgi:hypothetical protein